MVWLVKVVWNEQDSRIPDRCAAKQKRFANVTVECDEWSDAEQLVRFHRRYRTADAVSVVGDWTDMVSLLGRLAEVSGGHPPDVRASGGLRAPSVA
jgi:hypothetical protein